MLTRCLYFNAEMTNKYQNNIDHYTAYYIDIIGCIEIFLQEDQLMHTKLRFPLVPVPTYIPSMHEMELNNVRKIEDTAFGETKRIKNEMMVSMNEHQENQEQQ